MQIDPPLSRNGLGKRLKQMPDVDRLRVPLPREADSIRSQLLLASLLLTLERSWITALARHDFLCRTMIVRRDRRRDHGQRYNDRQHGHVG